MNLRLLIAIFLTLAAFTQIASAQQPKTAQEIAHVIVVNPRDPKISSVDLVDLLFPEVESEVKAEAAAARMNFDQYLNSKRSSETFAKKLTESTKNLAAMTDEDLVILVMKTSLRLGLQGTATHPSEEQQEIERRTDSELEKLYDILNARLDKRDAAAG